MRSFALQTVNRGVDVPEEETTFDQAETDAFPILPYIPRVIIFTVPFPLSER